MGQMEGDVVVVEDWVSDSLSEEVELPNEECFSHLVVEPLAFSLPLALEGQDAVGVESTMRQKLYLEWFQSRFCEFDNFLGTSLQGLEKQATNFWLAVEAELNWRDDLEKKNTRNLKSLGV